MAAVAGVRRRRCDGAKALDNVVVVCACMCVCGVDKRLISCGGWWGE